MKRNPGNAAIAESPTVRAGDASSGPPPVAKPRLLLVDDERQVLAGLTLHLCRKYDVVARTSGATALEALDQGPAFSAVISDLRMPNMSGVELLREVRVRAPQAARVLLTGYADLTSAIAAVNDAGVHRFLTKPCPPAEVARALTEALESASRSRDEQVDEKVDEQMTRLGRQAALGTMAGSIGQEIGNLVAALAGSLDIVQSQVERGELPATEDIGLIGVLKTRLQEHTRALKDLARPRERRIESLDVGGLVCGSVDLLKKAGVLKVVRTQIDLPRRSLQIAADRGLIEGVLINLLKNAAEALAEKAEASSRAGADDDEIPLIIVGVEPRGDEGVAILVEDNGTGIAQENLARVFNTYFTTKSGLGGTGLGLAIARETIGQHGGRIGVESVQGRGTQFTVLLPLSGCVLDDTAHERSVVPGTSAIRRVHRRPTQGRNDPSDA